MNSKRYKEKSSESLRINYKRIPFKNIIDAVCAFASHIAWQKVGLQQKIEFDDGSYPVVLSFEKIFQCFISFLLHRLIALSFWLNLVGPVIS